MSMYRCATALLLGMALSACGAAPESGLAAGEDADKQDANTIIGGTPDTGDPSIVALLGKIEGKDGSALCTATFIKDNVLLTAAHCVDPRVLGGNATFTVATAPDLTDKNNPGPRLKVKETHFHPQFDRTKILDGYDIAVVILEQPAQGVRPIKFNRQALTQAMVNQPARLVGYGLNDGFGQKGAGIKRQANLKLNSFDEKLVKTGDLFRRICSGDSGGPVLMKVNNEETVVGVNSFGLIFCLGDGASTRVDKYLSFLDPYLK